MNYRTKRRTKAFSNFIIWLLIVLLLLGAIGFIYRYTGGFNGEFKAFYVKHNGRLILDEADGILIEPARETKFEVGYTFGFIDSSLSGYHVKIEPHVTDESDFDYTVGGNKYKFSEVGELTEYFDIRYEQEYFTVKSAGRIAALLERKYPGETVDLGGYEERGEELFVMTVSSESSNTRIKVYFGIVVMPEGLILDKTEVVF